MSSASAALASDDPTGTKTKRENAIGDLNSRWQTVRGRVRSLLENEERLKPQSDTRESIQIADFRDELERYINEDVVEPVQSREARRGLHYSAQWVEESYKHGLALADAHLERAGYETPETPPEQAIRETRHQEAIERQRLRTYTDIEEAARNAQTDASRRYAEAIGAGVALSALISNPSSNAPEEDGVNNRIDKRGQTGTKKALSWHIVETVNDASLNRYSTAGVDEVTGAIEAEVDVQEVDPADAPEPVGPRSTDTGSGEEREDALAVRTAGDRRVCPECIQIAADGPYALDTVRQDPSLRAPYHHFCRCVMIPTSIQRRNQ